MYIYISHVMAHFLLFLTLFACITQVKSLCEGDWQYKEVPIDQNELDSKLKPELFCPTEAYMFNCYYHGAIKRAHNITKNRKWVSSSYKCQQFDAKAYLNLIKNRKVFYIGDSTTMETWQSIICNLYQSTKAVVDVHWDFHQVCIQIHTTYIHSKYKQLTFY